MTLAGLRVLDLTRYIPGPYAAMTLGDLGADVVKVEEPPLGDPTRVMPPPEGEDSAAHAALNRNKRSVVLDIRSEAGALAVRRLAASADVLLEAFRPGVLARRGLGPDVLRADNPRLVYCSITGFGTEGEDALRAGHDVGYLSLSGFLGGNRDAEGRPVLPLAQVADMMGGQAAVIAILAALHARERTGQGAHVQTSLAGAAEALMSLPLARLRAGGPADELTGTYACYSVYRCRDGRWLSVGALEPKFWEGLVRALGRPALASRQWDGTRREEVKAELAALFLTRDRADWLRDLASEDVCVEPVLDPGEVPARAPSTVSRKAPALGVHTEEVLLEAGLSRAEIDALRPARVMA